MKRNIVMDLILFFVWDFLTTKYGDSIGHIVRVMSSYVTVIFLT
jgi:hypothetical protein